MQRQITRSAIVIDYAADLDELAFPGYNDGDGFAGDQRTFPTGYGSILDGLAEGLDIRLKTPVCQIDYGAAVVKVQTSDGDFEADAVVVTVPLGVLKTGSIRFQPELPRAKRAAIERLGMGLLNKLVVRFDKAFWPAKDALAFLDDRPDQWPHYFNLQRLSGQPVLVAFKGGRDARADERRTDEELLATMVAQLRSAFGSAVGEPTASYRTRWSSDPWSGGSYSFLRVGSSSLDRETLAAPLASRLFFAGEATHRDHAATVHGAYLSGLRAAQSIFAPGKLSPTQSNFASSSSP